MRRPPERRWYWLLALLLTPGAAHAETDHRSLLVAHAAALANTHELFAGPVLVELKEVEPAVGELLRFHWQDGLYREQYHWLGFNEAFGFDGREHWHGSDINLPYPLDDGRPSITLELVRALAHLHPPYSSYLGMPRDLPPLDLEGYDLLRFAPPKMHEALLLLSPQTHLLEGALIGDAPRLADSHAYTLLSFEQWRDFDGVLYPAMQRLASYDDAGVLVRQRVRHVRSVVAAVPLEPTQFSRAGAPEPPRVEATVAVDFDLLSGTPLLECTGPDGQPLRLLLDTGASVGLLRSDTAQRLGLQAVGAQHLSGHGGTARVGHVRVEGVTLGGVALPPYPAAVLLEAPERGMESQLRFAGIDGIIGNHLLSSAAVELDYGARRLTLAPPGSMAGATSAPETRVLRLNPGQLPWVEVVVDGRIRGGAFLNTGGGYLFSLSVPAIDAAGVVYPVESLSRSVAVHGPLLSGTIRPGRVHLGTIRGSAIELSQPATVLDLPTPGEPLLRQRVGSLGSEFLSRYRVGIDLAAGRLLLTPVAD